MMVAHVVPHVLKAPTAVGAAVSANLALAEASSPEGAEGGIEEGDVAPWPTASEETAFLSGSPEGPGAPVASAVSAAAAADSKPAAPLPPIPSLEELVKRVPDSVKELLDDLFRARFTTVRRL